MSDALEKLERELDKTGTVLAIVVNSYEKALKLWRIVVFTLLIICMLLTSCLIYVTAPSRSTDTALSIAAPTAVVASVIHRIPRKEEKRAAYV